MGMTWEEAGWERVAGPARPAPPSAEVSVGRRRLPVWDCTAGLVVGDGAALLIDAGSSLREGAQLRRQAESLLGGRRVTHLALTHPHFDHVLGGAAFAGVEVFGALGVGEVLADGRHEALAADAVRNGADRGAAAEAADLVVRPRQEVAERRAVDLGGGLRVVLANVGPGHTRHDLAVVVPGSPATVFCGDLVEESGEPQAGDDAVPSRWPDALDRLLALGGPRARYVPGHGSMVDAAFVRAQRDRLAAQFGVS
ncbi:Metallo-beta-lactamase superfamily protein [Streptomyces sp. YIM 130001]|uniref:MBL fold metallo-hydrolase n=1 Tax=Streptomyces sp. YIM 130001 TaxID=2259644 RepID=UPI000E64B9B7|nr:MBL fold metallo-hydrolase [Streptomyces sp. YIM 130001]RII08737.1 Metallo-beta-lactamase superfamily protein [Streptomyces sp. YIM 130001]